MKASAGAGPKAAVVPPKAGARAAWPHARAGLLAVHVLAVVLAAVPAPEGAMARTAWRDPTVQGEFDTWFGHLRSLGYGGTRLQFEDSLWGFAVAYTQTRDAILAPFEPYYDYAGTTQSWRMFVAPHRFPGRLHIEVRRNRVWQTVYVERSPDATWLGRILDHDRMRSAIFRYSWPQYQKTYKDFCQWIATQAERDFPDADRVRIRYFKYRTRSPAEVRAGAEEEGKYLFTRELALPGGA
jgi:hypothetical protein